VSEKRQSTPFALVGRSEELRKIRACVKAQRNVLLEGPVGVGKTHLALAVTAELARPVFRIDGDSRYSEQKLSGWFDPPAVIQKGFTEESFVAGPLVQAMRSGGVLFINELNRLPEGVQNVLLPAIDERMVVVPRLGAVRAAPGFVVVATQNPKEFVATSHLSEAILDRFELVVVEYQNEEEETRIVGDRLAALPAAKKAPKLLAPAAVRIARLTRGHRRVRRGASVRAALSVAEIAAVLIEEGAAFEAAFLEAVLMALPTRIEIEREADADRSGGSELEAMLKEWTEQALSETQSGVKKKT
jgi:MoxR-like ATPase